MDTAFLTRLLGLLETGLTAGATLGPEFAPLLSVAKSMLSGGPDPTPEQWTALDTLEQSLSDQIDAASK